MHKSTFIIKDKKKIPYSDYDKSVKKTLKNGQKESGYSTFVYSFIRLRNYFLMMMALIMPFNSVRVRLNKWKGVNIGKGVYIGMFVFLDNAYPDYIYIEDYAAINAWSIIVTHFNPYKHFEKVAQAMVCPVIIKKGALIAIKSTILPNVTIGEYAIVTAASVISQDVKPYTIVRGNPAIQVADYRRRMTGN